MPKIPINALMANLTGTEIFEIISYDYYIKSIILEILFSRSEKFEFIAVKFIIVRSLLLLLLL